MCCNEGREKELQCGHTICFRNMKVIAKFCEMSKARSIVFKSIWKDTVSHDKTSSDNNFGREMRAFSIHHGNAIRSKPGCKLIRSWNMG